jgi:hypothetical protein
MLRALHGKASDRKLRLFAVASCRCSIPFVQREQLRGVANTIEQYADGQATYQEMVNSAKTSEWLCWNSVGRERALTNAAWCASAMNLWYWLRPLFRTKRVVHYLCEHDRGQSPHIAALLREIFGNPFRLVLFSAKWRTDTATALARQMYDSRDFGAMPILADALQDAGCDNEHILNHCRDANATHVRGCWVVDLVLGKE